MRSSRSSAAEAWATNVGWDAWQKRRKARKAAKPKRDQSTLHGFIRSLLVLLGVAGLGAGAVAVFIVNRDFSPIALLAVGALLLLVGGAGRLPRFKWEGTEVDFTAALGDVVSRHVEDLPRSDADALVNELRDVSPAASEPVLRAMRAQDLALEALWGSLPAGVKVTAKDSVGTYPPLGARKVDGLLENADGKRLLVEFRASGTLPPSLLNAIQEASALDDSLLGGLLLTSKRPREGARLLYEEVGWKVHVVDPADMDTAALKTAVWAAFSS